MKKLSMEELERLSVQEFKETQKSPLILVLDNVRSLNNVGSANDLVSEVLVYRARALYA